MVRITGGNYSSTNPPFIFIRKFSVITLYVVYQMMSEVCHTGLDQKDVLY